MIVIADAGATKTRWAVIVDKSTVIYYKTTGLHCLQFTTKPVERFLNFLRLRGVSAQQVSELYFYGAGCFNKEVKDKVKKLLMPHFPQASIEVFADTEGAAKAIYRDAEGIVLLLSTGSAAVVWNGYRIVDQIQSLGYLFGDEGSGYAIAHNFLTFLFHQKLSNEVRQTFFNMVGMDEQQILHTIYSANNIKASVASFFPYIFKMYEIEEVNSLILNELGKFINRFVVPLRRAYPNLPMSFCGSVAHKLLTHRLIRFELKSLVCVPGHRKIVVLKEPLRQLVKYHIDKMS